MQCIICLYSVKYTHFVLVKENKIPSALYTYGKKYYKFARYFVFSKVK